jgi:hypothetical protein
MRMGKLIKPKTIQYNTTIIRGSCRLAAIYEGRCKILVYVTELRNKKPLDRLTTVRQLQVVDKEL